MGDINSDKLEKIQTKVIPGFVQSKMVSEMPKMMGKKLASKGMVAEIEVIQGESKQDQFFQAKLNEARKLMGKE